ncbi:hypothetical protein AAFF_G00302160 [Aldrovandia affinis]|uniref:Uncharacterized protein n=1 Tax=Aldrovandia affinis TaxID=143900 RepID=A0AAD7W0X6_9TELE|nr:hypothetical protein AAFF_G00302160 [Aldrovandia affinis]
MDMAVPVSCSRFYSPLLVTSTHCRRLPLVKRGAARSGRLWGVRSLHVTVLLPRTKQPGFLTNEKLHFQTRSVTSQPRHMGDGAPVLSIELDHFDMLICAFRQARLGRSQSGSSRQRLNADRTAARPAPPPPPHGARAASGTQAHSARGERHAPGLRDSREPRALPHGRPAGRLPPRPEGKKGSSVFTLLLPPLRALSSRGEPGKGAPSVGSDARTRLRLADSTLSRRKKDKTKNGRSGAFGLTSHFLNGCLSPQ